MADVTEQERDVLWELEQDLWNIHGFAKRRLEQTRLRGDEELSDELEGVCMAIGTAIERTAVKRNLLIVRTS